MNVRGDKEAVSTALGGIRQSMESEGYRLTVSHVSPDRLGLQIEALAGSCEECLAPPVVLKMMVSGELDRAYEPEEIDVILPTTALH